MEQSIVRQIGLYWDQLAVLEGQRLNFSPKYAWGLSGDYTFPLNLAGLKGRFGGSLNYTAEEDSTILVGAASPPLLVKGDPLWYGRANFSVLAPTHWSAMLFVDNIANVNPAFPRISPTIEWTPRIRPRTVGLQIEYKY